MRSYWKVLAVVVGTLCLGGVTTATASAAVSAALAPRASQPAAGRCVNADRWPFVIRNNTNGPAFVYDQRDCTGRVIEIVRPGESAVSEFGQSAFYPS
jgi:hypothetical protein